MESDITILYYTANRISDYFANNVRRHLLEMSKGIPIISVTKKPMDFGDKNICVGNTEHTVYNIYRQILIGALAAKTDWVACCEDDCLYNEEHLQYRPDKFAYNINRWNVNRKYFFYRKRAGMCMGIAPRKLMVETLEKRFEKYPIPLKGREAHRGWGEPGRCEKNIGLPEVAMETFTTNTPTLTFSHRPSMGGIRRVLRRDTVKQNLSPYGNARSFWKQYHG